MDGVCINSHDPTCTILIKDAWAFDDSEQWIIQKGFDLRS